VIFVERIGWEVISELERVDCMAQFVLDNLDKAASWPICRKMGESTFVDLASNLGVSKAQSANASSVLTEEGILKNGRSDRSP